MNTIDTRSLSPEQQEVIRKGAVKAFLNGKSISEVCTMYSVSRQSLHNWVSAYIKGGEKSLNTKKQGRPEGGLLKNWQCAQIVKIVKNYCPNDIEMPYFLWSREAVSKLILNRYEISLSKTTVGRYLKKWGFTSQKPIKRAYERNDTDVIKWVEEIFPTIRKRSIKENTSIFWEDESGLSSENIAGKSYGIKGQKPVIKKTGKRFRCNMISAISNGGKLYFSIFDEKFDSDVFIKFLKKLCRESDRKVFVITDRHPVHKSKKVETWLKRNRSMIEIFFLPGYCPELNPDELLNNDIKSNALGRYRPRTKEEMKGRVRNHLRMRQKQPAILKNFFHNRHVKYAA